VGEVRQVVHGPSCDVLEVGDGPVLVPFVSDAITRVDVASRTVEVDRDFLGLDAAPE
jgi:ribosomal 30S subunit maturation factor RimM